LRKGRDIAVEVAPGRDEVYGRGACFHRVDVALRDAIEPFLVRRVEPLLLAGIMCFKRTKRAMFVNGLPGA